MPKPKLTGDVYPSGYLKREGIGRTGGPVPPGYPPEEKARIIADVLKNSDVAPLPLACEAAGIQRSTFERWMKRDDEERQAILEETGEEPQTPSLRSQWQRARANYIVKRLRVLEDKDVSTATVKAVQFISSVHYRELFGREDRVKHEVGVTPELSALVGRVATDTPQLPTKTKKADDVIDVDGSSVPSPDVEAE